MRAWPAFAVRGLGGSKVYGVLMTQFLRKNILFIQSLYDYAILQVKHNNTVFSQNETHLMSTIVT